MKIFTAFLTAALSFSSVYAEVPHIPGWDRYGDVYLEKGFVFLISEEHNIGFKPSLDDNCETFLLFVKGMHSEIEMGVREYGDKFSSDVSDWWLYDPEDGSSSTIVPIADELIEQIKNGMKLYVRIDSDHMEYSLKGSRAAFDAAWRECRMKKRAQGVWF